MAPISLPCQADLALAADPDLRGRLLQALAGLIEAGPGETVRFLLWREGSSDALWALLGSLDLWADSRLPSLGSIH